MPTCYQFFFKDTTAVTLLQMDIKNCNLFIVYLIKYKYISKTFTEGNLIFFFFFFGLKFVNWEWFSGRIVILFFSFYLYSQAYYCRNHSNFYIFLAYLALQIQLRESSTVDKVNAESCTNQITDALLVSLTYKK